MELTDKEIKDLRTIYKNKFGEEISKEEAIEKGSNLVRLLKAVYETEDRRN